MDRDIKTSAVWQAALLEECFVIDLGLQLCAFVPLEVGGSATSEREEKPAVMKLHQRHWSFGNW